MDAGRAAGAAWWGSAGRVSTAHHQCAACTHPARAPPAGCRPPNQRRATDLQQQRVSLLLQPAASIRLPAARPHQRQDPCDEKPAGQKGCADTQLHSPQGVSSTDAALNSPLFHGFALCGTAEKWASGAHMAGEPQDSHHLRKKA